MPFISNIFTKVPPNQFVQKEILEHFRRIMAINEDRKYSLLLNQIKKNSGIQTRYSIYEESLIAENKISYLSTADRQRLYEQFAIKLINELCHDLKFENIDNVITVSCTGYQTPGIDFILIDALNLSKNVQRYHIGAMGCYAGITGLRLANKLCGNTLLLCLEFCSIHFQSDLNFGSLSSNSLFGDGIALIEVREDLGNFKIQDFYSEKIPNTLEYMSWTLGDTGFIMGLSPEVPQKIQENIKIVIDAFLEKNNLSISEIKHWVVHPGGTAILNAVQKALNLKEDEIQLSREILKNYGNMSSTTVFFILQKLRFKPTDKIIMMAFGPGLTVELALLEGIHA